MLSLFIELEETLILDGRRANLILRESYFYCSNEEKA